jgi:hypothetical protein
MRRSTEDGHQRTNREMAREPRGRIWWCLGCDRALVAAGQRFSNCGHKEGKRTIRHKPGVRE